MNILHIANDFCHTKVHVSLFKLLDEKGINQIIYNPVRDASHIGGNAFEGARTKIVYSHVVKPFHKYFYHVKQSVVIKDLLWKIDVSKVNLCHATTLFTDGGLAYKIHKRYHIPYIVAVRNTDINEFMHMLPNTWLDGVQVLLHAERIIFISEALKQKFERHFIIKPILHKIQDKFVLMPNGVDDYFLDNVCKERRYNKKVIYVGDFSENKNVYRLQEAVLQLRREPGFDDVSLTLVGGGKNTSDKVEKMTTEHPDVFNYVGKIFDKQVLCSLFRQHAVFAMPSIHETFGLVYVEALSQNLPVLYTKGQGVDGLFADSIGEGVNPLSVEDIKNALRKLLSNTNIYSNKNVDFDQFRWNQIANKYIGFYKECIGCADIKASLLSRIKKTVGIVRLLVFKIKRNRIHPTSEIGSGVHLRGCNIGKNCYIGSQTVLNYVEIGNYTCIAPGVQIGGMEHSLWWCSTSPQLSNQCIFGNQTTIGHDVWIAGSAIIKQGITIGDGAVVGANSFVNKDVPPYAIVVGSPARVIKYRFTEEQTKQINDTHYWELPPRDARIVLTRLNENIKTKE